MNLHNFTRGASLNYYVSSRELTPLADETIRTIAPSVFAEHAHQSRSQRYAYISECRAAARAFNVRKIEKIGRSRTVNKGAGRREPPQIVRWIMPDGTAFHRRHSRTHARGAALRKIMLGAIKATCTDADGSVTVEFTSQSVIWHLYQGFLEA